MGSLKDEMRGLKEDDQPCEKMDDGGCRLRTSQEAATQEDYQPKLHMDASSAEEGDKTPKSKDQVLSAGGCDKTDQSDSKQVKDCTQTDAVSETQQPEADKTTAAIHNNATISVKILSDGDDRRKDADTENILVPMPSTHNPSDPRSPAPFGQHHMRTQVSLEVVQCHSAATSPMTPPEGGPSFFFPSSLKCGAVGTDTKDAELQVGQQVEFCSVATSPMTPKTPSTTAFPELIGKEAATREEKVKKSEESVQQESFPASKTEAESEITDALKSTTSKELTEGFSSNGSPESSTDCPAAGLIDPQVTLEGSNQHCKQQRMGSMDQDITILVTHHGNNEEEEEDKVESSFYSIESEMVKIDEEVGENNSDGKTEDGKEKISTETVAPDTSGREPPSPATCVESEKSEAKEKKDACDETSVTKPPIPESPAPFGCHNIRTQVSLEVVQCQSVATSPMTPPEGDHAFYFPSSFGKCSAVGAGTKDAELQVVQQVEFRSVATAPMTPRTPIATTFPDIKKEASIEEKIVEEEEDVKKQVEEDKEEAPKKEEEEVSEVKKLEADEEDKKEAINCEEKGEENCEEPVQEVSWDEKGMTWEVYGAVVEVAVLGSAIQKHLEKQVKKQKRQSTMPPPPPLNPSATPLASEPAQGGSGSGKGQLGKRGAQGRKVSRRRRNPFRLLMENMQQPHCCSRAHTTE
ncbi:G protein-regulated inducer of neurite outgrowth 3 isoform X1 [Embiotoca jacksoni]|uniref:G protein-regulated inducer of neurite outgrowth 3 isoform X1 n=1 Tax=Embiotoca jacksoni TaxID=100190 RepID=UPI003703B4B2